ncbi:uncharacterized protein [Amphiura filiformis]|uniref:uncharacterized protein isoform X1 n=1 Tax=Amphiura filiformis TaxID=82378 RepID=UPI003B222D05
MRGLVIACVVLFCAVIVHSADTFWEKERGSGLRGLWEEERGSGLRGLWEEERGSGLRQFAWKERSKQDFKATQYKTRDQDLEAKTKELAGELRLMQWLKRELKLD